MLSGVANPSNMLIAKCKMLVLKCESVSHAVAYDRPRLNHRWRAGDISNLVFVLVLASFRTKKNIEYLVSFIFQHKFHLGHNVISQSFVAAHAD